jgi:hypothetical protein
VAGANGVFNMLLYISSIAFGNDISIIFIRLSESLHNQNILHWVKWLFVENEKNDMELYKSAWATSLNLRPKILENERKLKTILEKYQGKVEERR